MTDNLKIRWHYLIVRFYVQKSFKTTSKQQTGFSGLYL